MEVGWQINMETIKNLSKAFVGESQARNRYDFYAKIAKKEGYEQISEIFSLTAENEKVHAKRLFEHIQELKEEVEVNSEVPNVYGKTMENLRSAIEGENHEYSQMYPEFAQVAEKEGYQEIANRLRAIAKAEEHHEERFKKVLVQLENGTVFKKEKEVQWMCRECGYRYSSVEALENCPSCDHPQAYQQLVCEQY